MDKFIEIIETYLGYFAKMSAIIIEIIGIVIILIGMGRVIYYLIKDKKSPQKHNIKILLGNTLALSLEFKMGAEIIKTVVVKELTELIVLGVVVLLRAILAFLIHWEIKSEKKDAREEQIEEKKARKFILKHKEESIVDTKEVENSSSQE